MASDFSATCCVYVCVYAMYNVHASMENSKNFITVKAIYEKWLSSGVLLLTHSTVDIVYSANRRSTEQSLRWIFNLNVCLS